MMISLQIKKKQKKQKTNKQSETNNIWQSKAEYSKFFMKDYHELKESSNIQIRETSKSRGIEDSVLFSFLSSQTNQLDFSNFSRISEIDRIN